MNAVTWSPVLHNVVGGLIKAKSNVVSVSLPSNEEKAIMSTFAKQPIDLTKKSSVEPWA